MVGAIVLVAIFVIIIYAYMRHKTKKRSSNDIDSVQRYHASYDQIRKRQELRDRQNAVRKYVTKYNSSEDYREPLK